MLNSSIFIPNKSIEKRRKFFHSFRKSRDIGSNIATHRTELHQIYILSNVDRASRAFVKALINSFAHQTPTRPGIRIPSPSINNVSIRQGRANCLTRQVNTFNDPVIEGTLHVDTNMLVLVSFNRVLRCSRMITFSENTVMIRSSLFSRAAFLETKMLM